MFSDINFLERSAVSVVVAHEDLMTALKVKNFTLLLGTLFGKGFQKVFKDLFKEHS